MTPLSVLVYAFERYDRPDRWKFNKSRQNWLVRNVWNSQTVRLYIDLHAGYSLCLDY